MAELIRGLRKEEIFQENQFLKDIDIDLDALQQVIVRHSGQYWKYGKLHAVALEMKEDAELRMQVAEREHETLYAQLDEAVRLELARKDIKITEALVKQRIRSDSEYVASAEKLDDMRAELIKVRFTTNILSLTEKIFSKRTDLLETLGYMFRSERDSAVQVVSREEEARRVTERLKRDAQKAIGVHGTKPIARRR